MNRFKCIVYFLLYIFVNGKYNSDVPHTLVCSYSFSTCLLRTLYIFSSSLTQFYLISRFECIEICMYIHVYIYIYLFYLPSFESRAIRFLSLQSLFKHSIRCISHCFIPSQIFSSIYTHI